MIPPDLGSFTVEQRPNCMTGGEERRRGDVGEAPWVNGGKGRTPCCASSLIDKLTGLALPDTRPQQLIETEHGSVSLPTGPEIDETYMPSSFALNTIMYADTRRTAISDRYYR